MKSPKEIATELYGDNVSWAWALGEHRLVPLMVAAIEADRASIQAYLDEHEHPDDWGVTCVYTSRLRESLGMPKPARDAERT